MKNLNIALTTTDDISALQVVLDQTDLFPSEMLPNMIAPALAGESEAIWLSCHVDGVAVGLCFVEPEELTDGTWNMLALAVLPELQGKKVGTALVNAVEELLKSKGQRILIVDTSSKDEFRLTRQFYIKNQYEEEAKIRDFWAAGDDKVTYRKAL
jgi:GNAT superfamily N-acetyltransferase